MGVAKIILFIIDVFHRPLLDFDFNATLKFFSELKNDAGRLRQLEENDFKHYVRHLRFDSVKFGEFESKHRAITSALNFENSMVTRTQVTPIKSNAAK